MKNKKTIICYDLIIDDSDSTEVNWMSMVEDPAIQLDWEAFSKDGKVRTEQIKFEVANKEKQMLAGVFMKANKPILRVDEKTGEEFAVKFTSDNIERAVKKFQRNGYSKNVDTEHNTLKNGSYIMDSWYIRDPESNPLKQFGFQVEPGDWVGTVHVPDKEIWDEYVKTGVLKGFSVMGLFKFGEGTEIQLEFSAPEKSEFTKEELDLIGRIADLLLDDEDIKE